MIIKRCRIDVSYAPLAHFSNATILLIFKCIQVPSERSGRLGTNTGVGRQLEDEPSANFPEINELCYSWLT